MGIMSLLDFHLPTIQRFSSLHLSVWGPEKAPYHIESIVSSKITGHVFESHPSRKDTVEEDVVFIETIGEDVLSVIPFNGKNLVTHLPYRIVTQVHEEPESFRWMVDSNCIIGFQVSAIPYSKLLVFVSI